jgi:hypothetical protein
MLGCIQPISSPMINRMLGLPAAYAEVPIPITAATATNALPQPPIVPIALSLASD